MEDQENKIEKYLSKEMSGEELGFFEKELAENNELSQEVESYKTTIKGMNDFLINQKLDGFYEELFEEKTQSKNRMFYYISGIAASLLIIITASYIFFFKATPTNNELYLSYYEPMPDLFATSRGGKDDLKKAYDLYTAGNYKQALELFLKFPDDIENKERVDFYMAMTHMALNNNNEAIKTLKTIPLKSVYQQQINWYLGLAYLKENKNELSIQYFTKIQSHHFKFKEAKEILDNLE